MKKKYGFAELFLPGIILFIVSMYAYTAFADIDGRIGRTLKTSTSGCSCHSSRDVATSVTITGPGTVTTGTTNTYTLTISRATKTGAGCDIAARSGTLAPVSSTIHLSGLELTHNDNIPMTGNQVSILFSYTAPATPTTDTIFATGLATNSNGEDTGDLWNWAASYRVVVIPPPKILHLTLMMEGFYNPGSGILISDTARVYLRNISAPYAIVDSAKAFLNSSGNADFSFANAANGTPYYIAAIHRNSIETWSAGGNSFSSNSMTFNFTSSAAQAYGSNQKLAGTKWTIFSGDVNLDGVIDGSDSQLIDNDAYNFTTGYVVTDVNGDEIIDGSDATITGNNSDNFVSKITP